MNKAPVEDPPVHLSRLGPVLHVRLNRPHVRNAINHAMAVSVAQAMDDLAADPDLRVAVIDGAGATFSSGMDFQAYLAGERPVVDDRGLLGIARRPPEKPLIAAVEGYALGAGFETALACDIVVAAETAVFGLPEVQRGMVAGGGGMIHLAQRVPRAVASDLVLTGRRLTATEAATWGLVSRVAPAGGALELALEIADAIATAPLIAVATAREVLAEARWWPPEQAFEHQAPYLQRVVDSPDSRKGAQAFLQKKAANPARSQGSEHG